MSFSVLVVGATGLVGETLLQLLSEREFPINRIVAIASDASLGDSVMFGSKSLQTQSIDAIDFGEFDIAFFCAGEDVSKTYAPAAAASGCMVIDNTATFRYDSDVPLVVPEVNPEALANVRERNIVANPNCSTIQMVMLLKPLHDMLGVTRVNVATYQAVAGAGRAAVDTLAMQTADLLSGKEPEMGVFPQQIAFNLLPMIDAQQENGYSREEMKLYLETQKILNDPNVLVNATAVRVPVFYGHGEALHIETQQAVDIDAVKSMFEKLPGITVIADDVLATPFDCAANNDDVFVARLRQDVTTPFGLNCWCVADNLRKGAALNAIQIAELIFCQHEAVLQ